MCNVSKRQKPDQKQPKTIDGSSIQRESLPLGGVLQIAPKQKHVHIFDMVN